MNDWQPSNIIMFDNSDPEIRRAYENARATFRYFWREVAWERRRIVKGLDLADVKAPFADAGRDTKSDGGPKVEQMCLGEIDFDGQSVSGVLLNSEHPMSEAMAPTFKSELLENPSLTKSKDDRGWTFLHHQAMAGSAATVKGLLEGGADPDARTDHGMTPMQLAKSLGWERVVALLESKGANQ